LGALGKTAQTKEGNAVPVILAYIFVVIIWSTTPLAIQWSSSSLSFLAAVALRMVLALAVCLLLLLVMRRPLIQARSDWKAFAAGGVGLFPNMLIVYWSAQYIPSGLMAVVLGVYPFFVGLFSLFLLKENVFTVPRFIALFVAIAGLVLIHYEQMLFGAMAVKGVLGMLLSAVLFAASSVWLKAVGGGVDPLRQSAGVLLLSAPCFAVVWWLLDGTVPEYIDTKSISGVSYLVLAGSVLGHTLFFYVLRHCHMGTVSLITLITPVIAMVIGVYLADEVVTVTGAVGAALIVVSLAVYQSVGVQAVRRFFRWLKRRQVKDMPALGVVEK
jgi:drug/metabolite transporter (DMT)-like permease